MTFANITGCSSGHEVINISSTAGTIFSSPGYPETKYPNDRTCRWNFLAPLGHKVLITVLDIDTEYGYDTVTFFDGSGENEEKDPILSTLSGNQVPRGIVSIHEEMRVTFTADISHSGRGFKASAIAFIKEGEKKYKSFF